MTAGLSSDRKKIWVNAKYDTGPIRGYANTYWISDISNGNARTIKSPAPPIAKDVITSTIPVGWNNTSDSLVILPNTLVTLVSPEISTFNLETRKTQVVAKGYCGSDPDFKIPTNELAWSSLNKEIYCYHQDTNGDLGIATFTLKDQQSHFLKFVKPLSQEPSIAFSPNADYVALDWEVYPLREVAYYNGSFPKVSNPQPVFTLSEPSSLCPNDSSAGMSIECPIWSSAGRYVLYERKKTQTEKIAEIYDTKLKKTFSYDLILPDYPNLKYATIATILDSKNLILRGGFGDGTNRTYKYFLVNPDAGTIVQLPSSLDKLVFIS